MKEISRRNFMKGGASAATLAVLASQTLSAYADDSILDETSSASLETDYYVMQTLTPNLTLQPKGKATNASLDSLKIAVARDMYSVTVILAHGSDTYRGILPGEVTALTSKGFVSVYEGDLIANNTAQDSLHVILDVTSNGIDYFVVVTSGYASDSTVPVISFFGEQTSVLKDLASANSIDTIATFSSGIESSVSNVAVASVDSVLRLKATGGLTLGSYSAGQISIFHANQLANQGSMPVKVKVNTNTSGVNSYVANTLGYGVANVVGSNADIFYISIRGDRSELHNITNSYLPQNSETSFTVSLPVFQSGTDIFTVPLNIQTSSTQVSATPYPSGSPHYNKISWELYRMLGWSTDKTDGNYSTSAGISVDAHYSYAGTVTSNISTTMTGTLKIRYAYVVLLDNVATTVHLSTGTKTCNTALTIVP